MFDFFPSIGSGWGLYDKEWVEGWKNWEKMKLTVQ
jgi:hypothetical protein